MFRLLRIHLERQKISYNATVDGIKQKCVQSAMEMQRRDWLLMKSSYKKEHLP